MGQSDIDFHMDSLVQIVWYNQILTVLPCCRYSIADNHSYATAPDMNHTLLTRNIR